jgi:hypothetical protein
MVDEELVDSIIHQLKLSGLAEVRRGDGPSSGGFAVEPDRGTIYVVWSPSDELADPAFDCLRRGDATNPAVRHLGTVSHAMAGAMLTILKSAGFNAVMSADDLSPATIEVGPAPATAA